VNLNDELHRPATYPNYKPNPLIQPGVTVPSETTGSDADNQNQQDNYGPNNEYLPERLQQALLQLTMQLRRENLRTRIDQIRACRQAHLFYRGQQYLWWDERSSQWYPATNSGLAANGQTSQDLAEQPHYEYVTNIYKAFLDAIIAVLSQDTPKLRVFPASTQNEQDMAYAEHANDAIDLIERNNCSTEKMQDLAFKMCVSPVVGGFIRYVTDGERFGFHPENEFDEVITKLGDDTFQCSACGTETPSDNPQLQSCPNCNAPLTADNFKPAPRVSAPRVTKTVDVPNGQEVIDYYDVLNLSTSIWAEQVGEMPRLGLEFEFDRSRLRAAYPWVADKIGHGMTVTAEDDFRRIAKLQTMQGGMLNYSGDALFNLVTLSREWIRPWAFSFFEDQKLRDRLLELFPKGCYVAFAGLTYCESRNESMDDCWDLCFPGPGDGQTRPAIGQALIPVQQRVNDLLNLMQETAEYGIPPTYYDSEIMDDDNVANTTAEPAIMYPVKRRAGEAISNSFFIPPAGTIGGDIYQYLSDLIGPWAQFLVGVMPSLFGGDMTNQDTAQSYKQAHTAALARQGIYWTRINEFHARVMMKALKCMARNRTQDVEIVDQDENSPNKFASRVLPIDKLNGNIHIYPEEDSALPKMWGQQRQDLMELLASPLGQSPQIVQFLTLPENLRKLKEIVGLRDFELPGERAEKNTMLDIEQLLASQPVPTGAMDPMTGLPVMDPQTGLPQMAPSIQPDPEYAYADVGYATVKEWINGDAGREAKIAQPLGYENVRLYGIALKAQMDKPDQSKPPSTSISLHDLPPEGQAQLAAKAGIQIDPQSVLQDQLRETLSHHLPSLLKPAMPPPKPNGRGNSAPQQVQ
jgi:hypothetical protein